MVMLRTVLIWISALIALIGAWAVQNRMEKDHD
jgi:hypothetical protein